MRIAQVCPLSESVPPLTYGGTERVVAFLTEELVAAGHHVTLFASGDSVTRAELVACVPRALRLDSDCVDPLAPHLLMIEEVARRAADFDLVHFHFGYLHFPLMRRLGIPRITTVHGRLDLPDLQTVYRVFPDEPLVSISQAQQAPLPSVGWQGTVHHGLPGGLLAFHPGPGRYLAFLGRISPEKGPDRAIEIARRVGMPLKIAAKVDKVDEAYFRARIEPLLDDPLLDFVGEIDDGQKGEFLGNAAALLFPVDWPEPFGLVMIEAMACGAPVVAFARGSVPEIVRDGQSGFVVGSVDDAVAAVPRALALPRARCRAYFDARFTAARMAACYVQIYEQVIARERTRRAARASEPGGGVSMDPRMPL
ncbi:MAG TPA: glycosyltransferase family 4 protein [Polyangia bacterium]